jgi:hypothetical protein
MRKASELHWLAVGVSPAQLEKRGAVPDDEFGPGAWDDDDEN